MMINETSIQAGTPVSAEPQEEKKHRKKLLLILLCLVISIVMVVGVVFAFFSDVILGNEEANITAGTLDLTIDGAIFTYNGDEMTTIPNFNPGDVAVISIPVTNEGNKSAWLRGKVLITGTALTGTADNGAKIKVFEGAQTLEKITATTGAPEPLTSTADGFISEPIIINGGSGANDETETDGTTGATLIYTIYFDKSAGNEYQAKTIVANYTVQAMQYRNNPNPIWADVVTEEFSLN
jgi:hypothetical protein